MKSKGNGTPEICVQNLLKTIRGEIPYARIKGIDRAFIDKPSKTTGPEILSDVEYVIQTYEPRARLSNVELEALAARFGGFKIGANIDNFNRGRRT